VQVGLRHYYGPNALFIGGCHLFRTPGTGMARVVAAAAATLGVAGAHNFILHEAPLSWPDAAAACRAAGGRLAKVEDAAEQAVLATTTGSQAVWIGARVLWGHEARPHAGLGEGGAGLPRGPARSSRGQVADVDAGRQERGPRGRPVAARRGRGRRPRRAARRREGREPRRLRRRGGRGPRPARRDAVPRPEAAGHGAAPARGRPEEPALAEDLLRAVARARAAPEQEERRAVGPRAALADGADGAREELARARGAALEGVGRRERRDARVRRRERRGVEARPGPGRVDDVAGEHVGELEARARVDPRPAARREARDLEVQGACARRGRRGSEPGEAPNPPAPAPSEPLRLARVDESRAPVESSAEGSRRALPRPRDRVASRPARRRPLLRPVAANARACAAAPAPANLCRIQPLGWVVLTKLENSRARSRRSRFG